MPENFLEQDQDSVKGSTRPDALVIPGTVNLKYKEYTNRLLRLALFHAREFP